MNTPDKECIAVIGIACRFPGASNYQQYWENLTQGVDSVSQIPPDRWDWRTYWGDSRTEKNKSNSRWGGFIQDADKFDAAFFGISPREAENMDPQQRLMLELSWLCLEDSGYAPFDLSGRSVGVFIGTFNYDYKELQTKYGQRIEGHSATGTSPAIIANRISYFFDFHGPSIPVDTACSSSLVAVHRGIEAIKSGKCELVVAGGINTLLAQEFQISLSKAGMLSQDGRCRTFDKGANGYA
ncbi:MAG: polyketide synthase, partial [Exilibacterium sp.]